MKELLYFYMPSCPHCKLATKYVEALKKEDDRYAAVPVRMIDETRKKALADSYDYWYVPCFYVDGKKLHEGHAEKADVRAVLEAALS